MPILTISEIVLGEIAQMQFRYGGSPADVVEYSDGGRKASGQAVSVQGLEAITDNWVGFDPTVVPTADEHGVIPEFYGPKGIIALKVDFGFGDVILRADAASLHKELRDVLLARLSELQVDNDAFRVVVTEELDAMRTTIDTTVADALSEVADIIAEQQDEVIQQAVEDKLASDLADTLEDAVNDVLANDIPPLIAAEVATQVPPAVAGEVGDLQDDLNLTQSIVDQQGITLSNTRYDLDAVRNRTTNVENRVTAVETTLTVQTWQRTVTFNDCVCTLKLSKFQGIVFGRIKLQARSTNAGLTGYSARTGMGIPTSFIPTGDTTYETPRTTKAAGNLIDPQNFSVGISNAGEIITQGYEPWNEMSASLLYFA